MTRTATLRAGARARSLGGTPHTSENPVSDPQLLIGIAFTALILALNTIAGWPRKPHK
jgi:hypothetical protein